MTYYAFINDNKIDGCGQCPCTSENITCVEISEDVYNNIDHYIWDGADVVLNPNYDEEQEEKRKQERNQEIDNKIKELNTMAIPDILEGNTENIKLYNEVIAGLEAAKYEI